MTTVLGIKGGHCDNTQEPEWYNAYCMWFVSMRDQDYARMFIMRQQSIREILESTVPKLKWHMINQAKKAGHLQNTWPPIDAGGLKGIQVDVMYDIYSLNWKCTLTYRTPTNEWAARFIIREIEIAQNL